MASNPIHGQISDTKLICTGAATLHKGQKHPEAVKMSARPVCIDKISLGMLWQQAHLEIKEGNTERPYQVFKSSGMIKNSGRILNANIQGYSRRTTNHSRLVSSVCNMK